MSTTVGNILTAVAYRRRENSYPNDSNEQSRQIGIVAEGQREVVLKSPFWFLQKTYATRSTQNQTVVGLPSDFRSIISLHVNRIPVAARSHGQLFSDYSPPSGTGAYLVGWDNSLSPSHYILYGDTVEIYPPIATPESSVNATTLTSIGTLATFTSSTNHGLQSGDYTIVSGAGDNAYNGTFRVTVLSSTQFTYTCTSNPASSPATGTITSSKCNILIRYNYWPNTLSSLGESVVIPDPYVSILVAYTFARLAQIDDERANAQDGADEFEDLLSALVLENTRRMYAGRAISAEDYQW